MMNRPLFVNKKARPRVGVVWSWVGVASVGGVACNERRTVNKMSTRAQQQNKLYSRNSIIIYTKGHH